MLKAFALFFASTAHAVCYLEDANAECAVCWKTTYADANDTTGVTKMSACDDLSVSTKWVSALPDTMLEYTDYDVEWDVKVPGYVVDKNNVPHANIHSCNANIGGCTPFIANTPGLSTHTAAIEKNLTANSDGVYETEFQSIVNLEEGRYTIIAHTRLMIVDGGAKPSKLDVAIGVSRTVSLPDVTTSTSAVISAAVAGSAVLLVVGAVIFAARKGILNPEKFLAAFLNSPFIGIMSMILGMGDVIAFLFTILSMVESPTVETADVLPIAIMVLVVSWIISFGKFITDGLKLYDLYILDGKNANASIAKVAAFYVAKEIAANPPSEEVGEDKPKVLTTKSSKKELQKQLSLKMSQKILEDEDLFEHGKELAILTQKIRLLYFVLMTILLEQTPLIVVSLYLLSVSETVNLSDAFTLFFSSAFIGGNIMRTLDFPRFIETRRQLLAHFHFDVDELLSTTNKVTPSESSPATAAE